MRKLLILTLAVLAVPVLAVHAAGTEPPAMVERPKDPDYENGKKALDKGDYKAAVGYFSRAAEREPDNASVRNELGYAYRKSGSLELAFKQYNEALRLDPKHRGAHEYLGEAYLMTGNLAKAEEQLAVLNKLCLFSCEEYRDLKTAIAGYKRKNAN